MNRVFVMSLLGYTLLTQAADQEDKTATSPKNHAPLSKVKVAKAAIAPHSPLTQQQSPKLHAGKLEQATTTRKVVYAICRCPKSHPESESCW